MTIQNNNKKSYWAVLSCDTVYYDVQGGCYNCLSLWMKSQSVVIQMKATKQCFPVVLFIILYKVVLTFGYVDEILKCDHLNESYWAVLSCGTVYYTVQGGSNFWLCG